MVATEGSPLLQTPPKEASAKALVAPRHMCVVPVIGVGTGTVFTVSETVAKPEQPIPATV